MNRLRKWLPGVGLSLFSLPALCASVVTVHQPGKTWSAEPADTLSRLVTQPQLNNVWWQGAVIATPSATRARNRRNSRCWRRFQPGRIAPMTSGSRPFALSLHRSAPCGSSGGSLSASIQTPCVPTPAAIVPLRAVTICGSRLRPAPSR